MPKLFTFKVAEGEDASRDYESMRSSEIGLRSDYAPLTSYYNAGASTDTGKKPVYDVHLGFLGTFTCLLVFFFSSESCNLMK